MKDYYELFSLEKNFSLEEIKERLFQKKQQLQRRLMAPLDTEKQLETEKNLEELSEAEKVFSDEASRKKYDSELSAQKSEKQKTNPIAKPINKNAKPTRKLANGIDLDNGNFFKTEYGKTTVISYDQAFEEINNTMCKMIALGPVSGQSHKDFYNEFLRIARIANHNRSLLDPGVIENALWNCIYAIMDGDDGSVANILSQNVFYYINELCCKRKIPIDFGYAFVSFGDWLFSQSIINTKYYRDIVKGFFMATKKDRSVPRGFYDLSYITKENENSLDIYYLEIIDYFVQLAISLADAEGCVINDIDTYRISHDLYISFREEIEKIGNGFNADTKRLKEIYNKSVENVENYESKSDYFMKHPYNAGLAYAVASVLNNPHLKEKSVMSLPFGNSIIGYVRKGNSFSLGGVTGNHSESRANSAVMGGIIIESIAGFGIIAGLIYLLSNGHPVWGFILAAVSPTIMNYASIIEKAEEKIGVNAFHTFYVMIPLFISLIFLLKRGHIIFFFVYLIVFVIGIIAAHGETASYGIKSYIALVLWMIVPCIFLWSGHVYSAIALLVIKVLSSLYWMGARSS